MRVHRQSQVRMEVTSHVDAVHRCCVSVYLGEERVPPPSVTVPGMPCTLYTYISKHTAAECCWNFLKLITPEVVDANSLRSY